MLKKVAVVGAGFIGRSWAMVFARAGCEVSLYDAYPDALEQALILLKENLVDLEANNLIDSAKDVKSRIKAVNTIEDAIVDAQWVQENALEQVEIKRELFAQMDKLLPSQTIIASSTSAIPCSEINS